MKNNATLLALIVASVLVSLLGSYCARAQTTPGAIPNPGTYQGSTQLQQEQDRQNQQYRQQSTQPFQPQPQQQPQGAYSGRSAPSSNASRSPDCLERLARQPELGPLAQKVYLGHPDTHSSALFGIQAVPTASERPLLLRWLAGRRNCELEWAKIKNVPNWSAEARRADNLNGQITDDMIVQLADGKLTYGQFNRQRTKNAIVVDNIP